MKNKLFVILGIAALFLAIGSFVGAVNIPGITATGPTTISGAVDVLKSIVRWVYVIFFIIAVLYILFAAFTYLTAQGDSEKVKNAKDQIIYAAIAIVVALLAVSIDTMISVFLATGQ